MDNNKIDEAELTKKIKTLVLKKRYEDALRELEDVDLRKVRQPSILCLAGEVYMGLNNYDQAEKVLLRAYEKQPGTRRTLDLLTTLYIDKGEYAEAEYYYKEFIGIASKDLHRYILRYRLDKAKGERLSVLIDTLEKLKDYEYIEEWAYELASLYDKSGETQKCIRECDEIVLWFGHGEYVDKAIALKCKLTGQPIPEPTASKSYDSDEGEEPEAEKTVPDDAEDEDNELTPAEQAALNAAIAGLNQETFSEEDQPYANAIDLSIVESGMRAERAKHSRETLADILNTAEIELQRAAEEEARKKAEAAAEGNAEVAPENAEAPEEAEVSDNAEVPVNAEVPDNAEAPEEAEKTETEGNPELAAAAGAAVGAVVQEKLSEAAEATVPEKVFEAAEEAIPGEEESHKEKNDIIHLFGALFGKKKKKDVQEETVVPEAEASVDKESAITEEAINEAAEEIAAAADKSADAAPEAAEETAGFAEEIIETVEEAGEAAGETVREIIEEPVEGDVEETAEAIAEAPIEGDIEKAVEESENYFEDDDETGDEPSDEISALFDEAERTLQTEAAETVQEAEERIIEPEAVEEAVEAAEPESEPVEEEGAAEAEESEIEDEAVDQAEAEAEESEEDEDEDEIVEEPEEVEDEDEIVEESEEVEEPEAENGEGDDEDEIIEEDDEDEIVEEFSSEASSIADGALISELFAMAAEKPVKAMPEEGEAAVLSDEAAAPEEIEEDDEYEEDEDEISDNVKASDTVMNIFGSVSSVKSIQSQLVKTFTKFESPELDTMDLLAPYDINFIVTGSDMSVKSQIAIGIAKALNTYGVCDKNKLVRASAKVLNERSFEGIFGKLAGGCLVIEDADELNERSIGILSEYVNKENQDVAIVLELDEDHMAEIFTKYPELRSKFLNIIHIGKYNENELVQLAKGYAKNKGYDISMAGATKLKRLLKERMRDGASVNYEDIMEITEEAISSLEKRNMRNLFMTVLENKYEDAAMFVLQSEDFDNINIPD